MRFKVETKVIAYHDLWITIASCYELIMIFWWKGVKPIVAIGYMFIVSCVEAKLQNAAKSQETSWFVSFSSGYIVVPDGRNQSYRSLDPHSSPIYEDSYPRLNVCKVEKPWGKPLVIHKWWESSTSNCWFTRGYLIVQKIIPGWSMGIPGS